MLWQKNAQIFSLQQPDKSGGAQPLIIKLPSLTAGDLYQVIPMALRIWPQHQRLTPIKSTHKSLARIFCQYCSEVLASALDPHSMSLGIGCNSRSWPLPRLHKQLLQQPSTCAVSSFETPSAWLAYGQVGVCIINSPNQRDERSPWSPAPLSLAHSRKCCLWSVCQDMIHAPSQAQQFYNPLTPLKRSMDKRPYKI